MRIRDLAFDAKVRLGGGAAYTEFLRASRDADQCDTTALLARQAKTAAATAVHAATQTRWYADRYRDAGIDLDELRRDPDVFSTLPIVEKADVRAAHDDFIARDADLRKTLKVATGGSTGEPLRLLSDATVRPPSLSWRPIRWWGVSPADNVALMERYPLRGRQLRVRDALWWPTRRIHLDAAAMDDASIRTFVEQWRHTRPRLVVGYTGALYEFARLVKERGYQLPAPIAISSTAAPLSQTQRLEITDTLGAPIYDFYRSTEVNYMAAQCERQEGLHVLADQRVVEVVDEQGRPVPAGTEGQVVVTDLLNRAFPIVRYRLGDLAAYRTEPCPCGRPFPVLDPVRGRSNDTFRLPSGRVYAGSVAWVFAAPGLARQFQFHQLADHSVTIKVVPGDRPDVLTLLDEAAREFSSRLADEVPVRIEIVDHIGHVRGKPQQIVSHLRIEDGPRAAVS